MLLNDVHGRKADFPGTGDPAPSGVVANRIISRLLAAVSDFRLAAMDRTEYGGQVPDRHGLTRFGLQGGRVGANLYDPKNLHHGAEACVTLLF
jgi:hypothetical protein